MTAVARQLEASNEGYGQLERWTFWDSANRRIIPGRACDCSSSTAVIVSLGGFPLTVNAAITTSNLGPLLERAGFTRLPYTASTVTREGDIVLAPGHHVVYALSASEWWSAEGNELGRASGGKPGDQTGRETRIRTPYDMTAGGTRAAHLYRPPAEAAPMSATTTNPLAKWGPLRGPGDPAILLDEDGVIGKRSWARIQQFCGRAITGVPTDQDRRDLVALRGLAKSRSSKDVQRYLNTH